MSKEFDFVITLKSYDDKIIRLISQLLIFISVSSFAYFAIQFFSNPATRKHGIILFSLIAIILSSWVYVAAYKYKPSFRLAFFTAGLTFLFYFPVPVLKYVLAILYIVIGLLEKSVKFNKEICVDKEGILINAIPDKFYPWQKMNNVIIRGQMITLDFKNNRIFQKEIEGDVSPETAAEFNAYCRELIQQNMGA